MNLHALFLILVGGFAKSFSQSLLTVALAFMATLNSFGSGYLARFAGCAAELLSSEFYYFWSQCTNLHFVMNESDVRLRTLVERMLKLYPTDRPGPDTPEIGGKRPYQPL